MNDGKERLAGARESPKEKKEKENFVRKKSWILALVLAVSLIIPMAVPAMAASPVTQVSRPGIAAWGPVTAYTPLSDWGTPGTAVATWKHPSWPMIPSSSAVWISTAATTEPEGVGYASWRRFQDTINIPVNAYNIQVSVLKATADNAEEVYWNGVLVGSDGETQGVFTDNQEWGTLKNYIVPAGSATPGANTLDFIVRNYPGQANPTNNPTGLIYTVTVTYDLAVLTNLTPPEAFNILGTTHTITATITPAVAGVPITFTVSGANSATGIGTTDASGVATFTYLGTNPGQDTITATLDGVTLSVTKYWLTNFLTGGGTIKSGKTLLWTVAGNVGYLPDGIIVGHFNIVDHATKKHYTAGNGDFDSLVFSGPSTTSPPATHNTGTFTASFTDKDGSIIVLTIVITDNDESGGGADNIVVTGLSITGPLTGGNFQVHDGFK